MSNITNNTNKVDENFRDGILSRARGKINEKISSGVYDGDEIANICSRSTRLLSVSVSEREGDNLRMLARLVPRRNDLRPRFSSHRPVIGPVIVFAKQILWRIFSSFLQPTTDRMELQMRAVIMSLGHEINERKKLEEQLVKFTQAASLP